MATVKVVSLAIRTLAKPISTKLKQQAQEHERFRNICINIAQTLHRNEMRMRVNLLGETTSSGAKPHIRALSESKAIATGANFLSEGFLFAVAVSLIMAESYRGYRKENKRRDVIGDRLESLEEGMSNLQDQYQALLSRLDRHHQQNQAVLRILDGVIDVGMRGGEMRRILAHDPKIAAALTKIEADQASLHTKIAAEQALASDKGAADNVPSTSGLNAHGESLSSSASAAASQT